MDRDDLALGEALHAELMDAYGFETESWATERVGRVAERLNAVRTGPPLLAEILWIGGMNAFAAPGRYVYITRALLQRCEGDDPVAFVLAHEMAHQDLGHVRIFGGWLSRVPRLGSSGLVLAALWRGLEKQLIGPENEAAADARALDLCLAAGYDGARCLDLLDILEAYALDMRDVEGVFGPDPNVGIGGWLAEARDWGWRRLRGYPPLRERRATLAARLHGLPQPAAGQEKRR